MIKAILRFFGSLYLADRFFYLFGGVTGLVFLSFGIPELVSTWQTLLVVGAALVVVDFVMLFHPKVKLEVYRLAPQLFSLGENNAVRIVLRNQHVMGLRVKVVDELPEQLQRRDFTMGIYLAPGEKQVLKYEVRPEMRGEYHFGRINVFSKSMLGLLSRRFQYRKEQMVPVYPSIIQMKKLELKANARISTQSGIKKIRRLGHSYEFEQIKNYVRGDDYRSINWKATGRRNELMVNQYEDEKAQQVYAVIDKSRAMKMPFNGLSLMDHAINTSLVITNIALQKYDKAGLLSFSDKIGTTLKADRSRSQLRKILTALYNEKERALDANYELLYSAVRNFIKGRSLLLLFTNFESYHAMERVLPILRKLNRQHLLVVVFFENTELGEYSRKEAKDLEDIYNQTIAEKFVAEKLQIVEELKKHRIQTVLTRPEELAVKTINKYLELKSKGLI